MPKFRIIKVLDDGTEETIVGYPEFEDGKAAKHYADQLQQMYPGVKYQPRPIRVKNNSHKQKGLVKLPFWGHPKCVQWEPTHRHIVIIDPMYDPKQGVIRYFENEESKEIGKSVAMELQTFLQKFFLNEQEQSMWTEILDPTWFSRNYRFGIARTEEEILKVYNSGLDSCMTKSDCYYVAEQNPVVAYATEDFGVAWVEDVATGRLKGRSVISPPRNIFGRIYGNSKVLEYFLRKEGYRKGIAGDWLGLKIKAKYISGDYMEGEEDEYGDAEYSSDEGYQAPYFDFMQTLSLDEDGKHLTTDFSGSYRAYNTNGVAAVETPEYNCDECGKDATELWSNGRDDRIERCYDCAKKRYGITLADHFPPNSWDFERYSSTITHTEDGYLVFERDVNNYRKCTITGKWFLVHELPTIFGERNTPAEAKEKYNEYWPLLENAFVSSPRPITDRGTLYQEVPTAA